MPPSGTVPAAPAMGRRAVFAWCLYDWANTAVPTVITTFLFSTYFTTAVARDPESGTTLWANTTSLTALAIAIASPLLGAIADQRGRRKPWVAIFTLICVLATAALWFVRPDPGDVLFALICVGVATFAFELATVFYNALLPEIAPAEKIGRISGWGWGLGYAGGLACLIISLVVFVQPAEPPFGLDKAAAEHVRIVSPLTALWLLVFSVPLFLWVPDRRTVGVSLGGAIAHGVRTLGATFANLRSYRNVAKFLVAQMIYTDGLNTLFAFGGIYAAGSFGMGFDEVLLFGILINVTAGLGAALFSWVDDWIGAKRTVLIALGALIAFCIALLLVRDKTSFYALAIALGAFFGPAQAASRSLMARLAPPDLRGEFFGLFALSGKITSFLGPALLGWVTFAFSSQRAGMAIIPVFLLVGMLILLLVREPDRKGAAVFRRPAETHAANQSGAVSGGSDASP